MHYHQATGGVVGISAEGQDDTPQASKTCLLVVGPGGPEYSTCGLTTGYGHSETLEFAAAAEAALALGIHSSLGPTYYVFKCSAAQGPSDTGKTGCISEDNGNDGFGCGDDDWIGSSTSIDVFTSEGYAFADAPSTGPPDYSSSTSQGHIGSPPSGSTPGHGAQGCSFAGLLINPSPISELTEDMGFDPLLYPKECAWKPDQFPIGEFSFAGGNSGAHGKIVSGAIQVIAFIPDTPDAPPPDPYSIQILFV